MNPSEKFVYHYQLQQNRIEIKIIKSDYLMLNWIILREDKTTTTFSVPNMPYTEIHKEKFERYEKSTKLQISKFLTETSDDKVRRCKG